MAPAAFPLQAICAGRSRCERPSLGSHVPEASALCRAPLRAGVTVFFDGGFARMGICTSLFLLLSFVQLSRAPLPAGVTVFVVGQALFAVGGFFKGSIVVLVTAMVILTAGVELGGALEVYDAGSLYTFFTRERVPPPRSRSTADFRTFVHARRVFNSLFSVFIVS